MRTLLLLFTLVLSIQAQAQLTNHWKLNLEDTRALLDHSRYDSIPQAVRQRAEASMNGREFHIKNDGTIQITWFTNGTANTGEGTWTYAAATEILSIEVDGATKKFKVLKNTAYTLMLEPMNHPGLFKRLSFNPITK